MKNVFIPIFNLLSAAIICFRQIVMTLPLQCANLDSVMVNKAAQNIVAKVDKAPSKTVFLIYSKSKKDLATEIIKVLEDHKTSNIQLILDMHEDSELSYFKDLFINLSSNWGLIFLIDIPHGPFLFSTVGRPDRGIHIQDDNLFCDWLANTETTIRTYSVDMNELYSFRQTLLDKVQGAQKIRITTKKGTDITITPRHWLKSDGEIWTPPFETESSGQIIIDGTAYWGPVKKEFVLKIKDGRVVNIDELDITDKQQNNVQKDLTRDDNSNVLAELGIGINSGALPIKDLMEAEQAKGTCHFGFGNNIMFEGVNKSSYHFDLTVLSPTIEVDGEIICQDGIYIF